jgi:hypothetical protein
MFAHCKKEKYRVAGENLKTVEALAGHWWLIPIILATQRSGGSWFEASPGK